jgi:excinuclease UvrABC nuclease subunit
MLYHRRALVYVGKAGNLKKRLAEHRHKISGRLNIDVADMGFKRD